MGLTVPKPKEEKPASRRGEETICLIPFLALLTEMTGSHSLPVLNKNDSDNNKKVDEKAERENPLKFGSASRASFFRWPKFTS